MAKIKQKLSFEGLTSASNQTPFLDNAYGFVWNGIRAYDNANLAPGQTPVETADGTGYAYNGGFGQRTVMSRTTEFSLRKFSMIDVGADDVGESVWIRGYRDGQRVIETFVFLDGTPHPGEVKLRGFKNLDAVDFVWGNFGDVSAALDAMVVKVEPPPAARFDPDAALL